MGLTAHTGRCIRKELLPNAGDEDVRRNLEDLLRIDRYLGGARILTGLLRQRFRKHERFRLLDVGAGACPISRSLSGCFPAAEVVSLDESARNLSYGHGTRVAADAFRLPFAPRTFDAVCCSNLLHHFPEEQASSMLQSMADVSRGWVICVDLDRRFLARKFLPFTNWFFRWGRLTLHDGPVSVEAAFQKRELAELARAAGWHNASVRQHLPWFRLSLVWKIPL